MILARLWEWIEPAGLKLWMYAIGFSMGGLYTLVCQEYAIFFWKPTQGTVVESKVNEHTVSSGLRYWKVEVRYSYVIEGRPYESDVFAIGRSIPSFVLLEMAHKERDRYRPGTPIEVWYSPLDPSQAALFIERDRGKLAPFAMGSVLLLIGIVCGWHAQQERLRRTETAPA